MSLKQKPNQHNRSHKPSENPLGKRSVENLHAAFDEAEAGNVVQQNQILSKEVIAEKMIKCY